jgi:large subunit ribosomal protein L4e
MASRPLVQVYNGNGDVVDQIRLPSVFLTPIRSDIVQFVHTNMRKNGRQPYAVAKWAGHQTSAESWGTGRAVARIPRVAGGGTHRAGQGAFGNMCRGGRMFGPLRTWRKWHRKIVLGQKRYAVASALAASAVPALVAARGHRISQLPEIPLVIANDALEGIVKTKKALAVFKKLNVDDDVSKVKYSVVNRPGKGKMRNRPYKEKVGPLVVVNSGTMANIAPAVRNLPGVEVADVARLNLLRLAPGGHLGRLVIWTRSAFEALDKLWGTNKTPSLLKKGFTLPRTILANPDISRVIKSDEIRSALRPIRTINKRKSWLNPFTHPERLEKLNPYLAVLRRKATEGKKVTATRAAKRLASKKKPTGAAKTGENYLKTARTAKFGKLLLQ